MAQIKQAVSVTNGSSVVTTAGDVTARVKANSVFLIDGGIYVPYTIASNATYSAATGLTTITLTGNYQGVTNATASGVFTVDFTYPDAIPTLAQGDVGTAAIFTTAMNRLQSMIYTVSPTGFTQFQGFRDAAAASAAAALASQNAAAVSATASATSATASASSASSAASSATTATTQATAASTSASNSATSATASANSATNAASSATSAANSATQASNTLASYAPLASPALTGIPTVPTAAIDTATTQAASTAFVLAQAASVAPATDGTATVGVSTRYARQDHAHALPVASSTVLGVVKQGANITIDGAGVISAGNSYVLPNASATVLGGIKVGSNLSIDGSGVLSAGNSYVLPAATTTTLGGIKVGTGLSVDATGLVTNNVGAGTRTTNLTIATAGQTVFAVPGGYAATLIDVRLNGYALAANDYTAINGTTITLGIAAVAGDEIETVVFSSQAFTGASTMTQLPITATANQTSFAITNGYVVGLISVFQNGLRLSPADYVATNGLNVVLAVAVSAGTEMLFQIFSSAFTSSVAKSGDTMTGLLTANAGISSTTGTFSGALSATTGTFATIGTPFFINSTNSSLNKIAFQDAGTTQGYAGANSASSFRVTNANNTVATFNVDQAGNGNFAGSVAATYGGFAAGGIPVTVNSTSNYVQMQFLGNGTSNGYIGAITSQSLRVLNGAQTLATLVVDQSGNGTFAAGVTATSAVSSGDVQSASQNGGQLAGMRNRIINGDMRIDQRNNYNSATLPQSTYAYFADRWLVAVNGANTTAATVNGCGNGGTGNSYGLQIVGAASVINPQFYQRIETKNSYDLASRTVAVSFWIYQNSGAAQSVIGTIFRANSTDNFSTIISDVTVSFASYTIPNNTWTKFTGAATLSASATTGIMLAISYNGSLPASTQCILQNVQLELGPVATPFEQRPISYELAACQRYYNALQGEYPGYYNTGTDFLAMLTFPSMRANPTGSYVGVPPDTSVSRPGNSPTSVSSASAVGADSPSTAYFRFTTSAASTTGYGGFLLMTASAKILLSAEL